MKLTDTQIEGLELQKEEALKALERNPNILERFKSTFPFIKLN